MSRSLAMQCYGTAMYIRGGHPVSERFNDDEERAVETWIAQHETAILIEAALREIALESRSRANEWYAKMEGRL